MSAEAAAIPVASAIQPRRFGLNLVTNVGHLGLTMVVGVLYVPFLVTHLGPAVYGLVPLISMVTSYMALMTLGLNSAIGRSLMIALGQEDHKRANLIFNVAFSANLALSALLLIPAGFAIANVDQIIRIPPGYESAARWLFAGTIAAFLLNQIRIPFTGGPFFRNRLDLANLVAVCETLTRVGLVVCLFTIATPRVEYIGMGILLGTVVSTVGMIKLWKVLTPTLRIQFGQFDWKLLRNMCCTAGWVVVSQLGLMLYLNIDLLLANRLFGPEQGGRYAAVLQLPILLRSLAYAVGGIFPPTMYQLYARGEIGELVKYLNGGIKFLGLVMALSIGLVCGFSEPLLRLWLGPAFSNLAPLLFVMAIHLVANLSVYPLYAVPLAADRVRTQGLVAVAVGVGNLLLALFLAKVCGWGLYGLAVAGAIMLTIRYFLFMPFYAARIVKQPCSTFFKPVLPTILGAVVMIGLCKLILWHWTISNWFELGLAATAVSLIFCPLAYFLLAPRERMTLREAVVRFQRGSEAHVV